MLKKKIIKFPVYLSAGQEFISTSLSTICKQKIVPALFPQHRCHSIYISFGGDKKKLINELLGKNDGCTYGWGGSASIHSKKIKMFGHDGLMGTQGPIGVGSCFVSKKPTIVFLGMLLQRKITFWRLWDGLHLKNYQFYSLLRIIISLF